MSFRDYQSKPTTRNAMKITDKMTLLTLTDLESTMRCRYHDDEGMPTQVDFKYHQDVEIGDYIVYLNDDDIYHCSAEVFAERNIVDDQ